MLSAEKTPRYTEFAVEPRYRLALKVECDFLGTPEKWDCNAERIESN